MSHCPYKRNIKAENATEKAEPEAEEETFAGARVIRRLGDGHLQTEEHTILHVNCSNIQRREVFSLIKAIYYTLRELEVNTN